MKNAGTQEKSLRRRWIALEIFALAFVAGAAALHPFAEYKLLAPGLAGSSIMPLGATMVLLAVCGANELLKKRGRNPLLGNSETLGLFFIILVGGWAACWGFIAGVMPEFTAPFFLATPQNQWGKYILPYLPQWLIGPVDEPYMSAFYVGLKEGESMPWGLWIVPAFSWSIFGIGMTLFAAGLGGLLARRWIDHDRLTFPHAEVILGVVKGFLSDKRFWIAVAIAAAIPTWNITQRFIPVFQKIPTYFTGGNKGVAWLAGAAKIAFPVHFGLLGLLYFVHTDIVISAIIFFFLIAMEDLFLALAGIKLPNIELYYLCETPADWQMLGALVVLVLAGLWAGRGSIWSCFKNAFHGVDDGASWLPPRATVSAFLGGGALLCLFMLAAGMGPAALAGFMTSMTISFIGISRIVAESGMQLCPNVDPISATSMALGTKIIAPTGLAVLVLFYGWASEPASNLLVKTTHGERLNRSFRFPRGTLAITLAAVAISTVITMYSTAMVAYGKGANAFLDDWSYRWLPRIAYDQMTSSAIMNTGPDMFRILLFSIGGVAMAVLMFLRNNVVGWFLHPIGFLLGHQMQGVPGHPHATELVFIGFIAWSTKKTILKLGGAEVYERYRPFFAGLIIGSMLPGLYHLLVNSIAGPPLR